jgi:hypothetical protein
MYHRTRARRFRSPQKHVMASNSPGGAASPPAILADVYKATPV